MGRGGMGDGGMSGHGGGKGGRGHGGASTTASDSAGHNDLLQSPALLGNDTVLAVQQDTGKLTARLDNGDPLSVQLAGHSQQTLNGQADVRRLPVAGKARQFGLQFADGSQLEKTWTRPDDGRQLQIVEAWKPAFLHRPVVFRRVYQRVD